MINRFRARLKLYQPVRPSGNHTGKPLSNEGTIKSKLKNMQLIESFLW